MEKRDGILKISKVYQLEDRNGELVKFLKYFQETKRTDRYFVSYDFYQDEFLGMVPVKMKYSLEWKYYDKELFLKLSEGDKLSLFSLYEVEEIVKKL